MADACAETGANISCVQRPQLSCTPNPQDLNLSIFTLGRPASSTSGRTLALLLMVGFGSRDAMGHVGSAWAWSWDGYNLVQTLTLASCFREPSGAVGNYLVVPCFGDHGHRQTDLGISITQIIVDPIVDLHRRLVNNRVLDICIEHSPLGGQSLILLHNLPPPAFQSCVFYHFRHNSIPKPPTGAESLPSSIYP
jgi:hypothetical protein